LTGVPTVGYTKPAPVPGPQTFSLGPSPAQGSGYREPKTGRGSDRPGWPRCPPPCPRVREACQQPHAALPQKAAAASQSGRCPEMHPAPSWSRAVPRACHALQQRSQLRAPALHRNARSWREGRFPSTASWSFSTHWREVGPRARGGVPAGALGRDGFSAHNVPGKSGGRAFAAWPLAPGRLHEPPGANPVPWTGAGATAGGPAGPELGRCRFRWQGRWPRGRCRRPGHAGMSASCWPDLCPVCCVQLRAHARQQPRPAHGG